jgi:hypothetical protein
MREETLWPRGRCSLGVPTSPSLTIVALASAACCCTSRQRPKRVTTRMTPPAQSASRAHRSRRLQLSSPPLRRTERPAELCLGSVHSRPTAADALPVPVELPTTRMIRNGGTFGVQALLKFYLDATRYDEHGRPAPENSFQCVTATPVLTSPAVDRPSSHLSSQVGTVSRPQVTVKTLATAHGSDVGASCGRACDPWCRVATLAWWRLSECSRPGDCGAFDQDGHCAAECPA